MRTLDSNTDAADQDFAKLVKASGSEYTTIATAGNFGDLCSIVLSTGETVYMASENSAAVNSDLKLPAIGNPLRLRLCLSRTYPNRLCLYSGRRLVFCPVTFPIPR